MLEARTLEVAAGFHIVQSDRGPVLREAPEEELRNEVLTLLTRHSDGSATSMPDLGGW